MREQRTHGKSPKQTGRSSAAALIGLACVFVASLPAHAITQIDFGIIAPTSGVLSFSGQEGDPLVGTNIEVDEVVGLDTTVNANSPIEVVNGRLNFQTGGSITQVGDSLWSFDSGGDIVITGGIPAIGITDDTTELLVGTFAIAKVLPVGLTFRVVVAEFVDVKDENFAQYFGLSGGESNPYDGHLNISFLAYGSTAAGKLEKGFESFVLLSGGVVNAPMESIAVVPTPTTTWAGGALLGALALGGLRRMRSTSWLPNFAA